MSAVALRPRTLGGSTAAAACGVHPYQSPIELWAVMTGRLPEPEETEAMRWGTRMESVIMDELEARGHSIEDDRYPVLDGHHAWLVGHPDGYVYFDDDGSKGLLEVKTCSPFAWPSDGTIPAHYLVQCQTYMHLTGLDRALLAVLVGGQRLELRTIDRSDAQIILILQLLERFMGYVERDESPPPIGTVDEREAIRDLFDHAKPGTVVRLMGDEWQAYQDLCGYRDQRDRLDDLIREREAVIKLAMGVAETAVSPSDRECATWRNVKTTRVDTKLLKESRPELASLFTTTTETRRFEIK